MFDRLTALLGPDVFFVPCEWGTKKPLVTYVERPFEGTKRCLTMKSSCRAAGANKCPVMMRALSQKCRRGNSSE